MSSLYWSREVDIGCFYSRICRYCPDVNSSVWDLSERDVVDIFQAPPNRAWRTTFGTFYSLLKSLILLFSINRRLKRMIIWKYNFLWIQQINHFCIPTSKEALYLWNIRPFNSNICQLLPSIGFLAEYFFKSFVSPRKTHRKFHSNSTIQSSTNFFGRRITFDVIL